MRWKQRRRSSHVQDRRGASPRGKAVGGLGGIGVLVIALIAMYMGADPATVLQVVEQSGQLSVQEPGQSRIATPPSAAENELADMVSVVLADTEDVWSAIFVEAGQRYQNPNLVLFTDQVDSACGRAGASMGPFYCPADQQIYIDLSFYDDLKRRHGAPGDFAQAYVVAHEVGHHVQNLLGVSGRVHAARSQLSEAEYNQLSVRLELQADFYAGLWAHHTQQATNFLEEGDIEEALTAASAIGDDRLQRESRGRVVPETFTHGTSAQRVRWFKKGFTTGDISQGDTFSASQL